MNTGDTKMEISDGESRKKVYRMDEYKPTNFIMAWSGGFDSTSLLVEMLKALKAKHEVEKKGCKELPKLTIVTVESVNVPNSKGDFVKERQRWVKDLLEPLINPVKEHVHWRSVNFSVDNRGTSYTAGLFLPQVWMSCIAFFLDDKFKNHVVISYIAGDHSLAYMKTMEELLKLNASFVHDSTDVVDTGGLSFAKPLDVIVSFPYRYVTKIDVMKKLYYENPKFIDYCFTCQYGIESNNICTCGSCKAIKSAMMGIIANRDNTVEIKEFFSKKLDELFGIELIVKEPEKLMKDDVRNSIEFSNNVRANCGDEEDIENELDNLEDEIEKPEMDED